MLQQSTLDQVSAVLTANSAASAAAAQASTDASAAATATSTAVASASLATVAQQRLVAAIQLLQADLEDELGPVVPVVPAA